MYAMLKFVVKVSDLSHFREKTTSWQIFRYFHFTGSYGPLYTKCQQNSMCKPFQFQIQNCVQYYKVCVHFFCCQRYFRAKIQIIFFGQTETLCFFAFKSKVSEEIFLKDGKVTDDPRENAQQISCIEYHRIAVSELFKIERERGEKKKTSYRLQHTQSSKSSKPFSSTMQFL